MMQVVSNLIMNAMHSMSSGGLLTVSVEDTQRDGSIFALTVEDEGCGIPVRDLPRIFERFFTTRGEIRMGMGLWLAKSLVQEHGGRIEIESSTGVEKHGTKVVVSLPRENAYYKSALVQA